LGDFNAKVGREEIYKPTIGKYSLHENTNGNGQRMIFYAAERNLVVKSTFFQHKSKHLATWKHPNDTIPPNQIDHVLISGRNFSDVINVKTCWRANVDSDHYLVVTTLRAHLARFHSERNETVRRFAINKLKDPQVATTFAGNINAKLQHLNNAQSGSPPDWQSVSEAIKEEATNTLGYQSPNDRNTWFDAECADITNQKNNARQEKELARTREQLNRATGRYKTLRRQEKKLHRKKKKELQDRTLLELERLQSANESRKFYKHINNQRKSFNPRLNICRARDGVLLTTKHDVLNRFKEHFDSLYNGVREEAIETDYSFLDDDGRELAPPTCEEVSAAISALKNNKAPGPDNIPAELLKEGGDELGKVIYQLVLHIWNTETLPVHLLEGSIVPLHKKGDKLDCENYRGIALLNTAYKVFAKVLYNKLVPNAELVIGECQSGFRRDRSTTDQIFNLRLILQRGSEFKVQTRHLFIDFKQAYDRTNRTELFIAMKELGFETKMIRLVKATLDGTKCRVKVQNDLSDAFAVKDGLKQGDSLSCLLFNLVLEIAFRRAGISTSRTLANGMVQILGFADDLDIAGRSHAEVEETFTKLAAEAERMGLVINESKTKYMDTTPGAHYEANKINISGHNFEVVNEFVYLGVLTRPDGDTTPEIQRRIMAASRCYFGLLRHLRSKLLTKKTKCQVYKTLIRPVLMYGCESWILRKSDEEHLRVFERKVLRTIFGGLREGEQWRRRYNFELQRDFGEPDIVAVVKVQRLRWAGHLARMETSRAPSILFRNNPGGRRGVGRPKARWTDGIQQDLDAIGITRWQEEAQDRGNWCRILEQAKTHKWL
jgi:sorting nexin-29